MKFKRYIKYAPILKLFLDSTVIKVLCQSTLKFSNLLFSESRNTYILMSQQLFLANTDLGITHWVALVFLQGGRNNNYSLYAEAKRTEYTSYFSAHTQLLLIVFT